MEENDISEIQNAVNTAKSILVATHRSPSADSLAASLSLYLALLHSGKNVTIACPTQVTVEHSDLVGVDQVKTKLDGKNILVSIEDYEEGSIEKVSYTEEQGKFNLIIQPGEKGAVPTEKIKISLQGASFDLIFVVDTIDLQYLDNLYTQEQKLYSEVQVINIDRHQNNTKFGKINIVEPQASSSSEIVATLLEAINIPLDQDIATNLLLGIQAATKNFQLPQATAAAFETAGSCLRLGAKRTMKFTTRVQESTPDENPSQPKIAPHPPQEKYQETKPQISPQEEKKEQPPEEWLQPKIYRGGTLL